MSQLENTEIHAGHLSTSRTNPSVIEISNQQQVLHRNTNPLISNSKLHTQYQNDHFLAGIQTYDGRSGKSFLDWDYSGWKDHWTDSMPRNTISLAKSRRYHM